MKLSKLIKEQSYSNYSEFILAISNAKYKEDYAEFEKIMNRAKKAKQYEFIGRFYVEYDTQEYNIITKEIFKLIASF